MLNLGTHHAYFIEGERNFVLGEIEKFLENENFSTKANPDYLIFQYETLTVEDARNLKVMHQAAAVGEGKRVSVISFSGGTIEAQNALLKIFEEPNPTSRFFIIAPSVNILLPTLKSRFEIIKTWKKREESDFEINPEKFLSMSFGEKTKAIKKILDKYSKEKITKTDIFKFIQALAENLREKVIAEKEKKEKLASTLKTLSYLHDRSSSVKMLLEHLVLSL